MERMIATTLYLQREQHERLKKLSGFTKIPFAVLLRQAVDVCIERNQPVFESMEKRGPSDG